MHAQKCIVVKFKLKGMKLTNRNKSTLLYNMVCSHIHVIFILFQEGFRQVPPCSNIMPLQALVPLKIQPGQTVLEIINQEFIISFMGLNFA